MAVTKLTDPVVRDIKRRYLEGNKPTKIAKDLNLSVPSVKKALKKDPNHHLSQTVRDDSVIAEVIEDTKKETARIKSIKDSLLTLFESTIREAQESDDKTKTLDSFTKLIDKLDSIQRLNDNTPTHIEEKRETKTTIDINKTVDQLKTIDQKRAFLLKQLNPKSHESSDGGSTE